MPPRRLGERTPVARHRREAGLSARRVVAVDQHAQWPERRVLDERHADAERDRPGARSPSHEVEGEAERGAVERVHRQTDRPPVPPRDGLAEQRRVRVVAAEHQPVERFGCRPDEGSRRCRCCSARAHAPIVLLDARRGCTSPGRPPPAASRRRASRGRDAESARPGRTDRRTVDGRLLLSVEAVGKNLLLTFEGGVVLRSHLRMTGRWSLVPRGATRRGRPWLVLRGSRYEGVQWNGPVLELHTRGIRRLGPDVLAAEPDFGRMVAETCAATTRAAPSAMRCSTSGSSPESATSGRRRRSGRRRLSPWRPLAETSEAELHAVLQAATGQMRGSLDGRRHANRVYRRVGRPCPRCGERIRLAWPGRRQPDRILVPGLPALIRRVVTPVHRPRAVLEPVPAKVIETDRRTHGMTVTAPHLYEALRAYCLAAFARIAPDAEQGEIPFVVERAERTLRVPAACARLLEERAHSCRSSRTRGSRSTSCALSRRRRSSRAGPPTGPSAETGALPRDRAAAARLDRPRSAAGSTGRTVRSSGCTASWSARCSAPAGRTRRRAARRPFGRRRDRARPRHPRRAHRRTRMAGGEAAHWRSSGSSLRAIGDPPRRSRRARRRGHRAPARHGGGVAAGPVVFERLDRRPLEPRPLLGIAATGAGRRAEPARPVARQARRRRARQAFGLGAGRRARRGAGALGALAVRI